jgi:hypothetical protein
MLELESLVEEVLAGEDLRILDRLTDREKEVAWQILLALRDSGDYRTIADFWTLDYETKPPTPEVFLTDPRYLSMVGRDLYPKWKETFIEIMDPSSGIHELILRGCIGSGKSFFGSVIMTYIITWLMHLRSPVETLLGTKSEASSIFLALLSTDKDQLEKNMWTNTIRMLRLCPFVQTKAHIRVESNYQDLTLRLPKNIILSGGSLVAHVLGQNLFAAFMDEANFRRSAQPQEEAYEFYYKIRRRVENRFLRSTGLGFVGLISSEAGEGVFLNRHCEEIRTRILKGKPNDAHVCQFAEWEIKPLELSGERFTIDIGDNLRSPKILEDKEESREGAKVISVPIEYRNDAEKELISFLADIAGTVPGRANKYFYNVEAVLRNFRLPNPVLIEIAELALDTEFEGSDYLNEGQLIVKVQGRFRPRIHPVSPRYIHIDLAKNEDIAGFAMVHVGDIAKGGSPIIHVDFVIGFQASARKPIDYDKILRLIYWLRDSGFGIGGISYDAYQSQHSMNVLDKEGFPVVLRSVDRMKDLSRGEITQDARKHRVQPEYFAFRSMLAEDRIHLPSCVSLRREMIDLIDVENCPSHEKGKSKDLIDSVVGAVANLVESEDSVMLGEPEDRFPVWGSMHAGGGDSRPKMPVEEKQLVEPDYAKLDNVFMDP